MNGWSRRKKSESKLRDRKNERGWGQNKRDIIEGETKLKKGKEKSQRHRKAGQFSPSPSLSLYIYIGLLQSGRSGGQLPFAAQKCNPIFTDGVSKSETRFRTSEDGLNTILVAAHHPLFPTLTTKCSSRACRYSPFIPPLPSIVLSYASFINRLRYRKLGYVRRTILNFCKIFIRVSFSSWNCSFVSSTHLSFCLNW